MTRKTAKLIKVLALIFSICILGVFGCNKNDLVNNKEIIGIVGAMDVEVTLLKNEMKIDRVTKVANKEYYIGKIGKTNVVVVKCDMGKVHAGICTDTLINRFGCTKIINTGVGGSLDDNLKMGDIVVSVDAVQHDFDTTPIGFKRGEIPYTGLVAFKADEELMNKAYDAALKCIKSAKVYKGRICTGDQFIFTKEQQNNITSMFGGLCCEMEGGAVAQVCTINKIPFVIIRSISDSPGNTSKSEYYETEDDYSIICAKVVKYMLENF